jgi:hypothetical protein
MLRGKVRSSGPKEKRCREEGKDAKKARREEEMDPQIAQIFTDSDAGKRGALLTLLYSNLRKSAQSVDLSLPSSFSLSSSRFLRVLPFFAAHL